MIDNVLEWFGFSNFNEILGLMLVFMLAYLVIEILKYGAKNLGKGLMSTIGGVLRFPLDLVTYRKRMKKNTTCSRCGRTLDRCVCDHNKGVSLGKRYRKEKLFQRNLKKKRKAEEKRNT